MAKPGEFLTIGETAKRAGVAASALRFYEERGLIESRRTAGNHRSYHRSTLRRISVIRVAQTLGLSLQEVIEAFDTLPNGRTPTARDWEKLSSRWRTRLDERIRNLEKMRDKLSACIGCGCLSMRKCALYNPDDEASTSGAGPRYLLEDE